MSATQNSDTYRTLGRSGTVVFEQALGTMTFGAEADEATSHAIIDAYVAGGGNFIDTADVYSAGPARRSSADGSPRTRLKRPRSSSQPRAGSRWAPDRTISGRLDGTCGRRWTIRCVAWVSSTSTCTRCMPGMRSLPSMKRCASSTMRSVRARSGTTGSRTSPAGSSPKRHRSPSGTAGTFR